MIEQMIERFSHDLNMMAASLASFMTPLNILVLVGALGLAVQAYIGFTFFTSSIWEKERHLYK